MLFQCCGATCGFTRPSTSDDIPSALVSKDQNQHVKPTADSDHRSLPTAETSFAGASGDSKTVLTGDVKAGHAGAGGVQTDAMIITTNNSGEVASSSQKGSGDALLIPPSTSAAKLAATTSHVSSTPEGSGAGGMPNGNSGSLPLPQHSALRQASSLAGGFQNSPRSVGGGTMSPKELFSDITHLVFLGAGAYGSVYEGMWHGAVVAIKFIKSDTLDSRSASAREATFSNMLAHPHVVQTFWSRSAQLDEEFIDSSLKEHMQQRSSQHAVNSFVSNEGFGDPNRIDNGKERTVVTTYSVLHALSAKAGQYITAIAMEYMDNCSLHEVVAQGLFQANSKWGPRIVLRALSRTAREVARGMWHLHSSGVIHGDLKPANVLLKHSRADRRGFVCKVSDFGLSRESVESERLVSAETWGTVSYMAPEHFKGHLCQASDVYSFGVMLQEMYTAERPYKNFLFGQIMMGVQSGQLRLQWPPGAPAPLANLSQRCMAFNVSDRPTFDVIIEELNSMETALRMEEYSRRTTNAEEDSTASASGHSRDSSRTKLSAAQQPSHLTGDSSAQSFKGGLVSKTSIGTALSNANTATSLASAGDSGGLDGGSGTRIAPPVKSGGSRSRGGPSSL